jgi:hypothetical protein
MILPHVLFERLRFYPLYLGIERLASSFLIGTGCYAIATDGQSRAERPPLSLDGAARLLCSRHSFAR